jgi:hypothetical protein
MNKKNGILLSHVYSIFKNSVQKFGLHGFWTTIYKATYFG